MAKLEAVADIHAQAVARAYEHGVTIAMGTDIALTGLDLPNAWGQNGSEPGHLVKLGMSPRDAIEAATLPVVELHISNVHAREEFRHHSVISPLARGIIVGFGVHGYSMAINGLYELSQRTG